MSYIRVGATVLRGAITLGEPITLKLVVGLACIAGGVALIVRSAAGQPAAERAMGCASSAT